MVSSFPCPACGKVLKYLEEKAGRVGFCPRCSERVVTPIPTTPPQPEDEPEPAKAPGPLTRMSFGVRCLASCLAIAGVLGILVAALSALLPGRVGLGHSSGFWALLFSACSLLLLGLVFYGQLTGCPSCGWWWTRERAEKEFLDREVFEKEGVTYGRSVYRTTYRCVRCGHKWSAEEAEEYRASAEGPSRTGQAARNCRARAACTWTT